MPHQIADVAQAAGQLDVRARGRGIARGMVVTKDHGRGALADQRAEHVARVDLDAGQRSAREAVSRSGRGGERRARSPRTPPPKAAPAGRGNTSRPRTHPPAAGRGSAARRRRVAQAPAPRAPASRARPRCPRTPASSARRRAEQTRQRRRHRAARAAATSTALAPRVPVPSTIASSSPSVSCSAPRAVSRSRGRASGSRAAMVAILPDGGNDCARGVRYNRQVKTWTSRRQGARVAVDARGSRVFWARTGARWVGRGRGFYATTPRQLTAL